MLVSLLGLPPEVRTSFQHLITAMLILEDDLKFFGPTNATDLWHVKKIPPQQLEHLTGKPAELAVIAMQNSSRKGENVLDLFGGSGSTMIGAEQTGRRAFLMELDAPYCDVIVDRYQRFTGKPAVLERTGRSPIPMGKREEAMR